MQRSRKRADEKKRAKLGLITEQLPRGGRVPPEKLPALRQVLIDRGLWGDVISAVNNQVARELNERGTPWPMTTSPLPSDALINEFRETARCVVLRVAVDAIYKPGKVRAMAAVKKNDALKKNIGQAIATLVTAMFFSLYLLAALRLARLDVFSSWLKGLIFSIFSVVVVPRVLWGLFRSLYIRYLSIVPIPYPYPNWDFAESDGVAKEPGSAP